MSEEKLYMVKNDEGSYITVTNGWLVHWHENSGDLFSSYQEASKLATTLGGHVVTLIEEPEKVVLTEEEAEIVERAHIHNGKFPATFISGSNEDEGLLMNAYVNGYTVAKEKKYNVKVPHTKDVWYYQSGDTDLLTICPADKELRGKFTESEIEHYGLQDCEKEEVTDDEQ
ncbi:DUF1642 domain-containing protein [Lacticaseibacillus paracasei]|uniref:DUF1642 domain-containing protein n=1 Tax=Lacticaseibacillus paracasei TaxID=1597 RepID=UPI000E08E1D3|nr:DUF1642 domain-containing protein [Lacticaseibacillus paracasei]RDG24691.1 hypothetical protein DQM17_07055 [Lacticaseibacillus paracasei]